MSEFNGVYRGSIFDIDDPEHRGRLRILVPAVLGDSPSAWAEPTLNPSPDFVPENGGRVWVQFEGGNINAPTYHSRQEVLRGDIAPGAVDLSALADEVPLDGGITTFVGSSAPALADSDDGDLWLDDDDHLWRFNGIEWVPHQDADIQAALVNAQGAANLADSKMAIYYQNDPPTLNSMGDPLNNTTDVGDLWFDLNDKNKLYSWDGTTWVTVQDGAIGDAQNTATQALNSANGKNTIVHSTNAPSGNGTQVGDTWFHYDASNVVIGQWRWSGSAWVAQTVGSTVIAALDAAKITTGILDVARLANIGTANIADLAVTNAKIADLSVTNAKIADLAVTNAKISSLSADKITGINISGNTITGATIIGGVFKTATTGSRVEISNDQADRIDMYGPAGYAGALIGFRTTSTNPSLRLIGPSGIFEFRMEQTGATTTAAQLTSDSFAFAKGYCIGGRFEVLDYSSSPAVPGTIIGKIDSLTGTLNMGVVASKAISAVKIADNTLTTLQIATNGVGSSEIADNAVAAIDIATNSITGAELADNSVTATHIATNAVGSSEIADNTVAAIDIATNGVGSSEIADNAVAAIDIATNSITGAELADNSVTATHIATNAVGSSEIAAGVTISGLTATNGLVVGAGGGLTGGGGLGTSTNRFAGGVFLSLGNTINTSTPPSSTFVPNARWAGTSSGGDLVYTSHANSSIRYKENLRDLADDVDPETVLAIPVRSYDWREDAPGWHAGMARQAGFIAEDLAKAGFNQWVGYDEEGRPDELDYAKWTILLQLVAQDQNRRIKYLESALAALV